MKLSPIEREATKDFHRTGRVPSYKKVKKKVMMKKKRRKGMTYRNVITPIGK